MAAAEITLCARCVLSGAIFVFLELEVIVVIKVVHVILLLFSEEVLIEVTVSFLFNLTRLNFKEKLR